MNGGSDEDVTNVIGLGVADGTVLFLNGGASTNTLNYDAGGEIPTITPGLLPGEVLISIPGAGIVDAINYQQINIADLGPAGDHPRTGGLHQQRRGLPERQRDRRHLHRGDPDPSRASGGFPASAFTASIDWGDPSPDLAAGTITQDASNPSIYYITGTHTFVDTGVYTVDNTVAFAGGTFTVPVNGVPITITFGPAGPTAGTPATAVVTQGPLAVSAFPVVGTEGIVIPSAPIATFIDAGGADPIGDYSATINIYDPTNTLIVSVPAASIFQHADAAQYTVVAPDFTLPEEGTYQVEVLVTDDGSADPITVSGRSTAVIADAPLTAGAAVLQAGQHRRRTRRHRRRQLHRRQPRRPNHRLHRHHRLGRRLAQQRRRLRRHRTAGSSTSPAATPTPSPASTLSSTNVFDVGGSTTTSHRLVHRHRPARHRRDQELHHGRGPEHRPVRAGDL